MRVISIYCLKQLLNFDKPSDFIYLHTLSEHDVTSHCLTLVILNICLIELNVLLFQ
jgi:hypothetical protein